ncbi:hypothetical protein GCM10010435_09810 [Winogradskya consettensis]|uniref:Outer membrane protein assembly factor BamB n=1 Tax=Winogradskya consettensis TaxID=113560 RepID=A0A919T0K8_9ACTN|nr:PQQ-binding-like beta-propeller repeat protein [Actinoplanes consettensis]GIM80762.1 hypothetical protein Aco04nite_72530 [Actinoplanes consettensis]
MSDALIDLGTVREPPTDKRLRLPRATFVVAVVALAGLLGGAAPSFGEPAVTNVPARLGDSTFIDRSLPRLYAVDPSEQQYRWVSTYGLPGGELITRTRMVASGTVQSVATAGELLLVSYRENDSQVVSTVATRLGAQTESWRVPAQVFSFSAAAGTALTRAEDGTWSGLDLATGQRRWTVAEPPQGFTFLAGEYRLIQATTDGKVKIIDTADGTVVTSANLPDTQSWPSLGISLMPVGDLLLAGGPDSVTAYAMRDLTQRWTAAFDLQQRFVLPDCAGGLCVVGFEGGLEVHNAATGAPRWRQPGWATVTPAGSALIVSGNDGSGAYNATYPLAILDGATGKRLADFGRWRLTGAIRADGTAIVTHLTGDVLNIGLLEPASRALRVLGAAGGISGDCDATADVLICRRVDASIAIWSVPKLTR